jgi:hypothetical protein
MLLTLIVPLGSQRSQAAIDSFDWLIADSDLIVRGRAIVVFERVDPTNRRYEWEEATIRVYETLKGPPPPGNEIKILRPTSHFRTAPWTDGSCLFLLVAGRRATYLKSPDFIEGRYLLIDPHARMISLDPPPSPPPLPSDQYGARDRQGHTYLNPLQTADGVRLVGADQILTTAEEIVARQGGWTRRPRPALAEIRSSRISRARTRGFYLYGSPELIVVPADDRWEADAEGQLAAGQPLDWIKELVPRSPSQELMGPDGHWYPPPKDYFRNDKTIAFLRLALQDPWGQVMVRDDHAWSTPIDQFEYRDHINRKWGFNVLRVWEVEGMQPPVESPLLPHQTIWPDRWWLAGLGLTCAPLVVRRRRQPIIRPMVAWTCLLLAAASTMLWVHSLNSYNSVVFASERGEHEISSCWGKVRILSVTGAPGGRRPAARMPAHGAVSLQDVSQVPHHLNYLLPEGSWSKAGIYLQRGLTPPVTGNAWMPTPSTAFTYKLVVLRFGWIVGLFLTYPVLRIAGLGRRALRARKRIERLRCPTCNYDLRHRPAQCPECGAATPLRILHASFPTGNPAR